MTEKEKKDLANRIRAQVGILGFLIKDAAKAGLHVRLFEEPTQSEPTPILKTVGNLTARITEQQITEVDL